MHAVNHSSGRRSFLKLGAIGLAVIAGGGFIATKLTDGSAEPLLEKSMNLDAASQQMLYRVFDSVLYKILPEGQEKPLLTKAIGGLDMGISAMPAPMQKELKGLLSMLTIAPTRFALAGRWSGWEGSSREEVEEFMHGLSQSDTDLKRLIYITLHDLATASYYGLEESWPAIGYKGPMIKGPGVEV